MYLITFYSFFAHLVFFNIYELPSPPDRNDRQRIEEIDIV
jgi:hypothetical protein